MKAARYKGLKDQPVGTLKAAGLVALFSFITFFPKSGHADALSDILYYFLAQEGSNASIYSVNTSNAITPVASLPGKTVLAFDAACRNCVQNIEFYTYALTNSGGELLRTDSSSGMTNSVAAFSFQDISAFTVGGGFAYLASGAVSSIIHQVNLSTGLTNPISLSPSRVLGGLEVDPFERTRLIASNTVSGTLTFISTLTGAEAAFIVGLNNPGVLAAALDGSLAIAGTDDSNSHLRIYQTSVNDASPALSFFDDPSVPSSPHTESITFGKKTSPHIWTQQSPISGTILSYTLSGILEGALAVSPGNTVFIVSLEEAQVNGVIPELPGNLLVLLGAAMGFLVLRMRKILTAA